MTKYYKEAFPNIKSKTRVFRVDYELENNDYELYINTLDKKKYSIQINFYESEKELLSFLETIKTMLTKYALETKIGYYPGIPPIMHLEKKL